MAEAIVDIPMEDAPPAQVKPATKPAGNTPRFEIKKWNAVAMWSWDICADTVSEKAKRFLFSDESIILYVLSTF